MEIIARCSLLVNPDSVADLFFGCPFCDRQNAAYHLTPLYFIYGRVFCYIDRDSISYCEILYRHRSDDFYIMVIAQDINRTDMPAVTRLLYPGAGTLNYHIFMANTFFPQYPTAHQARNSKKDTWYDQIPIRYKEAARHQYNHTQDAT